MRIVGVIPAAGMALRLQPLPCSKEVLPVGGRPVIEYLVERMRRAPCSELRVVTTPEKRDVIQHAERIGATVVRARPSSVSESLAAGLEGLAPGDIVAFGFPDTIWAPLDGFTRLVGALGDGADVALGLFRTPDLERSDVVVTDGDGLVTRIAVKPSVPPSDMIWGCAAAPVGELAGVDRFAEPGQFLDRVCSTREVRGVWLSDEWLDVGTPEALARATAAIDKQSH